MSRAKIGSTVKVRITGWLPDGRVVYTTGAEALTLTIGEGKLICGLEEEMVGMEQGETKTVTISGKSGAAVSDSKSSGLTRETLPGKLFACEEMQFTIMVIEILT